jgi:atrial natriuretic peptide receptor A
MTSYSRYIVYMDENGDAEGNYTLLARKPHLVMPHEYGLYPVGVFTLKENDSRRLVSIVGAFLRT